MVTQMDYPSTTQALFALIVMIIVLVFILVYCCWGTFACSKQPQETTFQNERDTRTRQYNTNSCRVNNDNRRTSNNSRDSSNHRALVILPYNNMVYIGDGETRRVYHFPMPGATAVRDDKPPSYGDLFTNLPPEYSSQEMVNQEEANLDKPPTYEECLKLFKSASNAGGLDKYFVASMEDLISICTTVSNSQTSSSMNVPKVSSISASSEPVLSNIKNEESSTDLPLSRTKSNILRCNLTPVRTPVSRIDIEAQLNNDSVPIMSRALSNLPLTVSTSGCSSPLNSVSNRASSCSPLEVVTESQQESYSNHLTSLEESTFESTANVNNLSKPEPPEENSQSPSNRELSEDPSAHES